MDNEVREIQIENLQGFLGREMLAVIDMPDGTFGVYHQTPSGVWPIVSYPTKRKALARVLQLAGTGPIAPQIGPENIEIKLA